MIGQYKKTLERLFLLLNSIKKNPNDLQSLLTLQLELIKYITRIESRIRKQKLQSKDASSGQYALFIFKTFGDAIAFNYLDKHNLKQLAFDVESANYKNTAGFISGKEGFQFELEQVKYIISNGVPCVLCDLTNSIRYGDILLLIGSDPIIIECKTNKTKSSRNSRQAQKLKQLESFYRDDFKQLRDGIGPVVRRDIIPESKNHIDKINEMITQARDNGSASQEVEKGLFYFVFTDKKQIEVEFIKYKIDYAWMFYLNEEKSQKTWLSYIPFTLTINDSNSLIDFICGEVNIIIIIDVSVVEQIAHKYGLSFNATQDSHYPFEFHLMNGNEMEWEFKMSTHLIKRIPLEFESLESLIKCTSELWIKNLDLPTAST